LEKLKVGIAGVGKLGRYHGQNFLQIPTAQLIGVYDIDQERGNQIAEELGVKYFNKYQELLKNIDAVSIAVPTIRHYDLASLAIENGKSVFIEKPITATIEEADKLVRFAADKNVTLQTGHIERFNPAIRSIKDVSLEPMFIEAHRLASFDPRGTDVAVILDLMIHDIDLVLSIVKSPVQRIDASGVAVVSDTEDIANARIQFENGCVANLTASRISLKKMRKLRLFQKDVYLSLDLLLGLAEIYKLKTLPKDEKPVSPLSWGLIEKEGVRKQIIYNKIPSEEENALKLELQAFVDSVLNKKPPVVSGEDGLRALEVANAILVEINKNK
jgi:predicted dehydrogenase